MVHARLHLRERSTGEGLGDTFPELRHCARDNFARDLACAVYHQWIWIDGQRVRNQRTWIVQTPGERFTFPKDNVWGAAAGPTKSATKGFMFVLRPSKGFAATTIMKAPPRRLRRF